MNVLKISERGSRRLDISGKKYGRLTAIRVVGKHKNGNAIWLCVCDCGAEKPIRQSSLHCGFSNSCGCLKRERFLKQSTIHGKTRTGEFRVWSGMMTRCYNKNDHGFRSYGASGIKVCKRWKSFGNFFNDMGQRPSPKHSIDRIDNTGNYEPGNCRWATASQQARNRRSNAMIEHNGRKMCVVEWSEVTGISSSIIYQRRSRGLPPEKILAQ